MTRWITRMCLLGVSVIPLSSSAEQLNFNPDWLFVKSDPPGAEAEVFDDREWAQVSAPHTYNDVDTFDDWSPTWRGHMGEYNQWGGRTWYRKHFDVPEAWRGKRIYIEFEAVRQVAEVYLNGKRLGKNENGFVPFGFDLTADLRVGAKNVLAVMCDNTFVSDADGKSGKWSACEGGAKFSWNNPHWHPAHGGIYRNVFLHIKDPVHITLPLYSDLGTVGTYVYTPEVTRERATVGFEAEVRNAGTEPVEALLTVDVIDMDGTTVETMAGTASLLPGSTQTIAASGLIKKPHLWEPDYPYLYTVRVRLETGGRVRDRVDIPLGVRSWEFTRDKGFLINGRRVKLQGWGQKSTDEWAGLGAAHPDWMHMLTLAMMTEAGGNFVRWGHTAGGPIQVRGADSLGLVTIQPGVDGEGDVEGHCWDVRARAFRDLIVYYRNNPSILIWEGGNQAVSLEHVKQLKGYVETFDPHGKRAYAHRRPSDTTIGYSDIEIGTQGSHKYPQVPVVEGEYDREESPRRVWDNSSPPDYGYKVSGQQEYVLTSEAFAVNQVSEYVRRLGQRSHCGGGNWIFSDSTSGGRNNSEVTRASGEVDAVRLPKEAYYACRAMFRGDPQVHILGHWTYPRDRKTVKPVYVVSNQPEVELFVNGRSLDKGRRTLRHLFTFEDVQWEPGEVKAVAYNRQHEVTAEQQKETVGRPASLRLTPITGPEGFLATGSDVLLIDVEAVDERGRRHPTVQQRVDFDLEGPGRWRGGYNSVKLKSTNHRHLDMECGINRVAVRSTRTPGQVTVTAHAEGLAPATVTVEVLPVEVTHGTCTLLPPVPSPAKPDPARIPTGDEAEGGVSAERDGRFIKGFSYSGYSLDVGIGMATNGAQVYLDRDYVFEDLQPDLVGADYVQLPNDEKTYQAVDLMDFRVAADGMLYVAHDDRLPRPNWLVADFRKTERKTRVHNANLTLFARPLRKGQSVTLGSNADRQTSVSTHYVVFFVHAP